MQQCQQNFGWQAYLLTVSANVNEQLGGCIFLSHENGRIVLKGKGSAEPNLCGDSHRLPAVIVGRAIRLQRPMPKEIVGRETALSTKKRYKTLNKPVQPTRSWLMHQLKQAKTLTVLQRWALPHVAALFFMQCHMVFISGLSTKGVAISSSESREQRWIGDSPVTSIGPNCSTEKNQNIALVIVYEAFGSCTRNSGRKTNNAPQN
jgi:hypothetical protein